MEQEFAQKLGVGNPHKNAHPKPTRQNPLKFLVFKFCYYIINYKSRKIVFVVWL